MWIFQLIFPIWNKLIINEQQALSASVRELHCNKGDLIRTGCDCTGLILIISGQLRAYTVSEDGREIILYRLFERDICLFSASCMMNSIRFDIALSTEKDTDAVIIPPIFTVASWQALRRLPTAPTKSWQADFRM